MFSKNGYPPIDKQNENYYYQVLGEGKIEFLVKKFKHKVPVKQTHR